MLNGIGFMGINILFSYSKQATVNSYKYTGVRIINNKQKVGKILNWELIRHLIISNESVTLFIDAIPIKIWIGNYL